LFSNNADREGFRFGKYLNGLGQEEHMVQLFNALMLDESGQDLAEYAILIGLIALAVIVAVRLLGTTLSDIFNRIATTLSGAGVPTGS
jgi:pilus assembly protein Flp/PilA